MKHQVYDMSLLAQLQERKRNLKQTETIVTHQDGQKFIETPEGSQKLNETTHGFVVDTKPDDIPARIIQHLYLGSQDCCHQSVLEKHCIEYVLSLGIDAPVKYPGITYKFVKILDLDSTKLDKYLPDCLSYIGNALDSNKNVLVHCNAGVSRSASIVIAYLVVKTNLTFEDALATVKTARPCVRPNDGFMIQLRNLSKNV